MIRSLLSGFVIFLLFLSLVVFGISWDLSSSLKYNNVEINTLNVARGILDSQINISQQMENGAPLIEQYCQQGHQSFSTNYQGYNITILCNDTNNPSQMINDTLKSLIKDIYSQNYNCSYWNCFKSESTPLFLISEESYQYWKRIFYYSLAASAILIASFVLLSKKRKNSPLTIGIAIAASSLPLFAIQKIMSTLPDPFSGIGSVFFSQSNYVFLRMIIIGGTLIIAGIIIKLILSGFKIYNWFHKRSEEKSTKEVTKKETEKQDKGNIQKDKKAKPNKK